MGPQDVSANDFVEGMVFFTTILVGSGVSFLWSYFLYRLGYYKGQVKILTKETPDEKVLKCNKADNESKGPLLRWDRGRN